MLNWIIWNRTVFDIETVLTLKWIVWISTVWLNWIAWNRIAFENYSVYIHLNCAYMLKWVVWNITVFVVLMLN